MFSIGTFFDSFSILEMLARVNADRHDSHALGHQPVVQLDQPTSKRGELAGLLGPTTPPIRETHRRHNRLLVHIQTRAPIHDHIHSEPPVAVEGHVAHGEARSRL